ncbi:hypothetical protein [Peredibacter starrii]|uniref:Uncharacterized protein n=1 Tax=Peredibacter starrii TaxID=28202 RepID=A0AAX4HLC1_9BACT|nr:hypothetical protein [Peredibacter starrii]WPU64117.1 hypothetical protein SOO65_15595 [Peredibacter starrii]
MSKIWALLFLSLFLVACNKDDGSGSDCTDTAQAEETGSTDCTVTQPPVTGETTGSTDGGTTGSTTGTTTGGGTTGSTTGGTTGSTTGGTTGSTTGGSTTGGTTGGLPTEAYTFDTDILFVNTTSTQQAKFDKAIEMIKAVVATEEFRSRVLNHTYNGKKTFVDNGGFTNAQIYQKILEAAEKLFPEKNNTMNMEVELYYAATTTVGYTYANSKRIWVNTKYFNTNSTGGVAANLFHEWLHKIGFGHATSYSTSRDYSVPYAIGRMISSIGNSL